MLSRARRRTLSFGLQTVLGIRPRGFFIPLRTAGAAAGWSGRDYEALLPLFRAAEPRVVAHLEAIESHAAALAALRGPPPEPRFDQTWFPRLDAAAVYALVRNATPRRIVEVGSGHSTRFIARAVRDGGIDASLTAVDPEPRADLSGLSVTLLRRTLQEAGTGPFEDLAPGDVVIVDSSHVLMPGTDVDILLSHVIPHLPGGVHVVFHDIFLPFAYPAAWPFTSYNEQNAVAPLLQGRADIVFSSAWAVRAMSERLSRTWIGRQPLEPGALESALILRLG